MLVRNAEWISCGLSDRAAIHEPASTSTLVESERSSVGWRARSPATTRPFSTSSTEPMTGWAARARAWIWRRPPEPGMDTMDPGSCPSTDSSMIGPDVANVRPARTAADQASNVGGASMSSRAYVRTAPTGTSADILSVPPRTGSR